MLLCLYACRCVRAREHVCICSCVCAGRLICGTYLARSKLRIATATCSGLTTERHRATSRSKRPCTRSHQHKHYNAHVLTDTSNCACQFAILAMCMCPTHKDKILYVFSVL